MQKPLCLVICLASSVLLACITFVHQVGLRPSLEDHAIPSNELLRIVHIQHHTHNDSVPKVHDKLSFLDSIPNLHPIIKEQWRKFEKSLDSNGRMTKECVQRGVQFRNNEVPDVHGKFYSDYLAHAASTEAANLVRDIQDMSIRNGRVAWTHVRQYREEHMQTFLDALYEENPGLPPDVDFWIDLNDGALCAPWLTEDCALPLLVHETAYNCAALLGTGRETMHPVYFKEPNFDSWNTKHEIAVWRGSTTGGRSWSMTNRDGVRFKLVDLSVEHPDLLDAKFTGYGFGDWELQSYLESTGRLCEICKVDSSRWHEWKYLVVVDGNSNPDRFPFFLATGSVVLRQEWVGLEVFEHGLKPWEHYIPVKRDLSDLIEKILWAKSHDEECKQIAKNAYTYINQAFTHPANVQYWIGLIKSYAEIVPRI